MTCTTPQAEATVDNKFRVVIPTGARSATGLKPGQKVIIDYSASGRKISMDIIPAKLVAIDA